MISLAGIVTWKALSVAGDEMDKNIVQYTRDMFNVLLGQRVAENVKKRVGTAIEMEESMEMEMRGRDLLSGLPKEVIITDKQVREAVQKSVSTIVENIKSALESTPPELVADIYERGIVLTGGGALLRGLDTLIAQKAEVPVRVAEDPITAVVRGAGALLEDDDLLHDVSLPLSSQDEIR